VSLKNKFEYDLLDLFSNIPTEGDPTQSYKLLVKRLAEECYPNHFYLLMLSSYGSYSDEDLIYTIYDSINLTTDYDGYQQLLPANEAFLKDSPILMRLRTESERLIDLNEDHYLKRRLIHDESLNENNKLWGLTFFNNKNLPVAYVLTYNKELLPPEKWEFAKKILKISIDKLISIYEEKSRIDNVLSKCARNLDNTFSDAYKKQEDVLQSILDTTIDILKAEKCVLFLVDSSKKRLEPERISGIFYEKKIKDVPAYNIENYDHNVKGTGITPWVLYSKKPFNARNYEEMEKKAKGHLKGNWDMIFYNDNKGARENFQCVYMVPLLEGDTSIGVLKYENRSADSHKTYFDHSDERIIDIIGKLIANIVISQRIERNRYNHALPRISRILISYFGEKSFYEKLLDECKSIMNAEFALLFLVDNQNHLKLKEIVGIDNKYKDEIINISSYGNYEAANGVTPWVLRNGEPFSVRNFPDLKELAGDKHDGKLDKYLYNSHPEVGFKSLYAIPLIIGDSKIGVFKVENKNDSPFYFTESDERLIDLIGMLIAVAVIYENEKYYGHMLRAAELGFLASGIAHEFNNYLQTITSCVSHINKIATDKSINFEVNEIKKTINSATNIIKNFRNIKNRHEGAKTFPVDGMINELLNLSRKRFKNSNINVIYNNHGIDKVTMNPGELQTIVINLLKNSYESIMELIETGKKREGIIEINIINRPPYHFSIQVVDSGKGISQIGQKHIFTPFYTTKSPKGMGVGLFWVQRIVNSLKGTINTESPNKYNGTTITIILPKKAVY
jgi:signal transduction histidine kinase